MSSIRIISVVIFSLFCVTLFGQVKYIDIEPDIRLDEVHHLPLDLDSNGSTDFILIHDTNLANWPNEGSQINVIHHMGINEIVGQIGGHFYPKPLAFNSLLNDQSKSWGIFEDNLSLYTWVITGGVLSHHGMWQYLSDDRFVGFRMQSDIGRVFGWIRLFVSPDGKYMILRDYAYMEVPESPMLTGQGIPVNSVQNLEVSDVFDFGDGRDLQLTFSPPKNEIAISHYRVLVIKSSELKNFDLLAAINVPAASFIKVYPSPDPYSFFMNESTKDVDGECIKTGEEYVVKVLSVGRVIDEPDYYLSPPTPVFSLNKQTSITENSKQSISVNIAKKQLTILSEDAIILNIHVYNMNGQVLKNIESDSKTIAIDLSGLSDEIVILSICTEQNTINRKLTLR